MFGDRDGSMYIKSQKTLTKIQEEESPSFADLPMELIIKIFSYLRFYDLRAASLTCNRWYDASIHPDFMLNAQLTFSSIKFKSTEKSLSFFSSPSRQVFDTVVLESVEFFDDKNDYKIWKTIGGNIKKLVMRYCDSLTAKIIKTIVEECPNLEEFELHGCSGVRDLLAIIHEGFLNLKSLTLKFNKGIHPSSYKQLSTICPNLKRFTHLASSDRKCPPDPQILRPCLYFFKNIGRQLKSLTLSDDLIVTLLQWKYFYILSTFQLEHLDVTIYTKIDNELLMRFLESQSNTLTQLEFQYTYFVDEDLIRLCKNLNLRSFKFCVNDFSITDDGIESITNLMKGTKHQEALEILHIHDNAETITYSAFYAITNERNTKIKEFCADSLLFDGYTLTNIYQNFINLRKLQIVFEYTPIDFREFFQHLPHLRHLELLCCLEQEQELEQESYKDIKSTDSNTCNVSNFKNLEFLILNIEFPLAGFDFKYVALLKNLRELRIKIHNKPSIQTWDNFIRNSASIESVDFSDTDYSEVDIPVNMLQENLKRLKYFNAGNCSSLTSQLQNELDKFL